MRALENSLVGYFDISATVYDMYLPVSQIPSNVIFAFKERN
jgi:hypothetical protein